MAFRVFRTAKNFQDRLDSWSIQGCLCVGWLNCHFPRTSVWHRRLPFGQENFYYLRFYPVGSHRYLQKQRKKLFTFWLRVPFIIFNGIVVRKSFHVSCLRWHFGTSGQRKVFKTGWMTTSFWRWAGGLCCPAIFRLPIWTGYILRISIN